MFFAKWLAAWCAVALVLSAVSRASAAEPVRAKVLIWVERGADHALVERVKGQVSDLDVELQPVEEEPSSNLEQGVMSIWFTRPDPSVDRVVVHARRSDQARAWIREIGDGAPAPSGELSSPTLEAAALVVREALRDMTRAEPPEAEAAPREPPKPVPRSLPLPSTGVIARPLPARLAFHAELSWQLPLDGAEPFERQGPEVLLGAAYRTLELSLFAGTSLPATEGGRYGRVRLQRWAAGVRAANEWSLAPSFVLGVGLRAGVVLYARKLEATSENVTPTSDRISASASFGPELRLAWAPWAGPMEFVVLSHVDAVPGAPRIGYEVDGRFQPSLVIGRLQPVFGLGVGLRLPGH